MVHTSRTGGVCKKPQHSDNIGKKISTYSLGTEGHVGAPERAMRVEGSDRCNVIKLCAVSNVRETKVNVGLVQQ